MKEARRQGQREGEEKKTKQMKRERAMQGDKIILPGIFNKSETLINGTENANKMKWSRRFSGENKSYKNTQDNMHE